MSDACSQTDHVLQIEAATGAVGTLTDNVQNSHKRHLTESSLNVNKPLPALFLTLSLAFFSPAMIGLNQLSRNRCFIAGVSFTLSFLKYFLCRNEVEKC